MLGLYHGSQKRPHEAAWIEIFVDQVLRGAPRWALYFRIVRATLLGHTLFHEIGHHIHAWTQPEHREREDVADDWAKRLYRDYVRRRHPILRLILRPLAWLTRPLTSRTLGRS